MIASVLRRRGIAGVATLALGVGAIAANGTAAGAATGKRPKATAPTAAQIRAAVRRAERSKDLWATINICDTARYPDTIGIRGQMPGLGFTTHISMTITVEYYSTVTSRFVPAGVSQTVDLGRAKVGAHQGGVRFPLQAPAAGQSFQLRGTVTFMWKSGSKLIAKAVRHTRHGIMHVDFSDPAGFSAGTCIIATPLLTPTPTTTTPTP